MLSLALRKGDTLTCIFPMTGNLTGTVGGAPASGIVTFITPLSVGLVSEVSASKTTIQGMLVACKGDQVTAYAPGVGVFSGTIGGTAGPPMPALVVIPVTGKIDTASEQIMFEGQFAARVADSCEIEIPPASQFTGTIGGLPASGMIAFPMTKVYNVLSTGSPKVKVG